ncbi:hypothetical protein F8388_013118 [Cannabis sativa]|uniref:Ubiquitin-like protease family profile domain-containing protein n=1 Tax=Cannabis sativa TaxID=3483 RepID=A0A7J6HMQ1_CANSA|nr:hypothetical protein F8388_013118 [Cannabis sativa]
MFPPQPKDNVVAWRYFFNANYKALRVAEKELSEKEIKLTSNPVILPNYYSNSEGRKSTEQFFSAINELKEYFSKELKSQFKSFSLKVMDKGEGEGGIDRDLEEDVAGEVGKKVECSRAMEESPSKTPVRSKTNVVGQSEENLVESLSTPLLSATKSIEDECYAEKTIEDDNFDILEVASFWNKGKSLVKSKKTQSDNVVLIQDDFNDKAYDEFIDSGKTVVWPFKTKEAIHRKLFGFYKFVFSNTLDLGLKWIGGEWHCCDPCEKFRDLSLIMFVPILTLEGPPFWFGAEVNMKSKVVSFMDSLHTAMDEKYRVDAMQEMLSTLDLLFDENKSKNVSFVDFGIDTKDRGLPQQDNDRDWGVYVMKYMEVVPNEEDVVAQFHPIEAHLEIVGRIISDELNELHSKVIEDQRIVQRSSFASSSSPLRSPSKSPVDPRFSMVKSRHANMYPPSRTSSMFLSTKAKISYGE